MKKKLMYVTLVLLGFFIGIFFESFKLIVYFIHEFEVVNFITLFSSIMTFVVFIMYLCGKFYYIKKAEMTLENSFYISRDVESDVRIAEIIELGENTSETLYFESEQPIRKMRFYEHNIVNGEDELLKEVGPLNKCEAVKIKTFLPCGGPMYVIKYEKFDFMKGEIHLGENGKDNSIYQHVDIKHTLKSYFYYLVK